MSDTASGGGAVGTPAVSPNTAGDAASAANMPAVPATVQRKSLSDFGKARREHSLPVKTPAQPPTTRERIGEFSRQYEARQTSHPEGLAENPDARQLQTPSNPRTGQQGESTQSSLSEAPADDVELQEAGEQPAPANDQGAEQESAPGKLSDAEIIAKYREWEQSDLAPEEIFADKLHSVKVRGQERFVDYNELRSGYMRQRDYTERGQELKQREAQIEGYRKNMDEHFKTIRDPEQFLEIYERNGYSDVLEQVAERISQRRAEHRGLVIAAGRSAAERLGFTPEQIRNGEADNHRDVVEAMRRTDERLKQTRAVEIENRKLSFERQRFEQERQAAQHSQEVQKHQANYQKQLDQLRPGAFKANGLQDTQGNRVAFLRHLKSVIDIEGISEQGITRAQVMSAGRALREELDDQRQAERGGVFMSPQEARAQQQAAAKRAALGPNRVATGAGKPLQAQQAQAKRPSDFGRARQNRLLGR